MALHDPVRLPAISRQAVREAYRAEENACVAERLAQAAGASAKHEEAARIAVGLISSVVNPMALLWRWVVGEKGSCAHQ